MLTRSRIGRLDGRVRTLVRGVAAILSATPAACALAAPATLYVSPAGRAGWSGRLNAPNARRTDGPLPTLQAAQERIRRWKHAGRLPRGGVLVELLGGTYEIPAPIEFTDDDSGAPGSPIVYQARRGEEVRITAGRQVRGWRPVTDPAILQRLDPAARGHVLQTDLRAQGVTDLAGVRRPGQWAVSEPGLELIYNDRPMTIARWPNRGFVRIADTVKTEPYDIRGTWGEKVGRLVYEGDRPARWVGEKEIWLHGYWFWDWADERMRVESIDTQKRIITLAKPEHAYGYRKGQWYYAFNLLSELDEPGEWYLDRDSGLLYFWPPSGIDKGRAVVTIHPNVIVMKNASHITFRGMILEGARGAAVTVDGGEDVRLVGCTLRNCGGWAVRMVGAVRSGVQGCDIYGTGDGGVLLEGGDRRTLTPAGLYVDNCHIHHTSRWNPVYKPGVMIGGVGNRVTHNLIDNAPHMAIGFGGNDHLIEYNEIHSVCYQSNDAGAMYAGRNWTMRGTVIRYNYLHHINGFEGRGCVGVYLDDQYCGTRIESNVFYKVTRAAMIGGGRDCSIENNVFVDCVPATHVDARGLGWARDGFAGLKADLEALPYKQPPWSEKYPRLVTILDDDPMAPKGNRIARNILVGGRWGDFESAAKPLVAFEDNLLEGDPKFVDAAHADFRLKPDSPAWKLGFKRIPIEKIGLYRSRDRASWPVTSAVRPMTAPPGP
jgi:hypothetical protein